MLKLSIIELERVANFDPLQCPIPKPIGIGPYETTVLKLGIKRFGGYWYLYSVDPVVKDFIDSRLCYDDFVEVDMVVCVVCMPRTDSHYGMAECPEVLLILFLRGRVTLLDRRIGL